MYCLGKETILRRLPAKQLGSARVKNSLKCNVIPLVGSNFLSPFSALDSFSSMSSNNILWIFANFS